MSVMQATSYAFETSCKICSIIRNKILATVKATIEGIILGQQLRANFQLAERLAGTGDFKQMTVSEVLRVLNEKTAS